MIKYRKRIIDKSLCAKEGATARDGMIVSKNTIGNNGINPRKIPVEINTCTCPARSVIAIYSDRCIIGISFFDDKSINAYGS
jgi:hypothetical protein